MPQQLIYTSSPRGLTSGRSGHCTVARSAIMRDALMLHLEKLSYYTHHSLSGGIEQPIYCCRIVDIRGSRYHVLSRMQDAGLDFTGRTNFIAHHLIFTPEELRDFPTPPIILLKWPGWVNKWQGEPALLENEDWSEISNHAGFTLIPAKNWQLITGDAINGYALLESQPGVLFLVDSISNEQVLTLFAESMELLEVRDTRRNFRTTSWQYTFTTSIQEQDNLADFRWRCLKSNNPAFNRFTGSDCFQICSLRTQRVTEEEKIFARSGRQAPRFIIQPQNVHCSEGEDVRLLSKAEGIPLPDYQWFAIDREGNGEIILNGTEPELILKKVSLGKSRYVVRASNSSGDVTCNVITLSVEPKVRPVEIRVVHKLTESNDSIRSPQPHKKSANEIELQSLRLRAEQADGYMKSLNKMKWVVFCLAILCVASMCFTTFLLLRAHNQSHVDSQKTPSPPDKTEASGT